MQVTIDEAGRPALTGDELFEIIYAGKDSHVTAPDSCTEIKKYVELSKHFGIPVHVTFANTKIPKEQFVAECLTKWPMPASYYDLDLAEFFAARISTTEQAARVGEEIELYEKYQLTYILKFMIFLVDTMREHKIVWGVGRGSSVASYCLYLIGLHKIDSLKFNLDITEFLK